jgi:AbrB family looped-hinge helix DNA binding protein
MPYFAEIGKRGQLTIPVHLRRKFGLKAGTPVDFSDCDGQITITPNPLQAVLALRGKYADFPMEEYLAESRRQDEAKLEALVADSDTLRPARENKPA